MSALAPGLIEAVWAQGRVLPEADPTQWRQDACGAWIRREHFGREDSEFGWKIERIAAGAQRAENLRPFHWRNSFDIAEGAPHCHVRADRAGVAAEKYARPPRNRPA
jgi:hypothetical protein